MMFKKFSLASIILLMIFAVASSLSAKDKKPYTFDDAMKFKMIRHSTISADGKWLAYSLVPDRGDATIYFQSLEDTTKFVFPRGIQARISKNSKWAAFQQQAKAIEIDNAKTPKDRPKNKFRILNLATGKVQEKGVATKFEFSNDGQWLAFQDDDDKDDKDKKLKEKQVGANLMLKHLSSGTEIRIEAVAEFAFDSLFNFIFYSVSTKNGETDGLYYRKLNEAFAPEFEIKTKANCSISNLSWSETVGSLAFTFAELDELGKAKDASIFVWNASAASECKEIISSNNITKNYYIPNKNSINWTEDGKRIYFGIKHNNERYFENREKSKYSDSTYYNLDTIADRADLYLWHWNDPLIMTNQVNRWKTDKDKYNLCMFNLENTKFVQIGDSVITSLMKVENTRFTLGYSETPYLKERTWYGDVYDLYSINLVSGERTLLEKRIEESGSISQSGKYIVFYKDKHWHSYNNETKERKNLTKSIAEDFSTMDFDLPMTVPSNGFAGWFENSNSILIYDNYDIWKFELDNNTFVNITNSYGKNNKITLRIKKLDRKKEYFKTNDVLALEGYFNYHKIQGIFNLDLQSQSISTSLLQDRKKYTLIGKPEFSEKVLFTRESYEEFPDFWLSKDLSFRDINKITDANPEIADYEWGTTELVRWVNSRGDSLDGYIIKPHNYNPKKRYPVYVYYYERFSDRTYNFSAPMINHRPIAQVYNSSGYLMFLPDIKYYIGNPGFDAMDAIMSGSKYLIDRGIADSTKFCIQGHSWSGYQTAFIVTQTDFFKAGCAGAPVGNMTSAYGQIRLESGLTRQFQYEAQQSRIGGRLWDSLDNYIQNSPIFNVNKAKTPLLIMFGDIDEAVPWQQGIELYMSYRRLSKNAIFLQYENEPHHPRKYHNKLDYAQKMKEFFDHYVIGKPAKDWIINGIPYKGK